MMTDQRQPLLQQTFENPNLSHPVLDKPTYFYIVTQSHHYPLRIYL